jgi:hypothetical protein
MILKSGARRPVSHISSMLRFRLPFEAAARLDSVEIAVMWTFSADLVRSLRAR